MPLFYRGKRADKMASDKKTVRKTQALKSAAKRSQPSEAVKSSVSAGSSLVQGKKIRVLLADDHKFVREAISLFLQREDDIEVVAMASDGQMTVELASRYKPDVILMDVSLPVLDGVEATARIVAKLPGIKVIGLSMYDQANVARKMRDAGAAAYLSKTKACDSLAATIRDCFRDDH